MALRKFGQPKRGRSTSAFCFFASDAPYWNSHDKRRWLPQQNRRVIGDLVTVKKNVGYLQSTSPTSTPKWRCSTKTTAIETSLGVLMGNVTSINGEFATI